MRVLRLIAVVSLLPGCELFFDDGGRRPDHCDVLAGQETDGAPQIAPAPLRDPEQLTCESFGGGCDPACGPCPAGSDDAPPPRDLPAVAARAPLPPWGVCGSPCETLDEAACAASSECRVVRDARCAVAGSCATEFVGCFPLDNVRNPNLDCFAARDGWTCSQSAACSALHDVSACSTSGECFRPFALCVPEGKSPGRCFEQAACDAAPPGCPPNARPGVANGCYTGACIPVEHCEAHI